MLKTHIPMWVTVKSRRQSSENFNFKCIYCRLGGYLKYVNTGICAEQNKKVPLIADFLSIKVVTIYQSKSQKNMSQVWCWWVWFLVPSDLLCWSMFDYDLEVLPGHREMMSHLLRMRALPTAVLSVVVTLCVCQRFSSVGCCFVQGDLICTSVRRVHRFPTRGWPLLCSTWEVLECGHYQIMLSLPAVELYDCLVSVPGVAQGCFWWSLVPQPPRGLLWP